LAKDLTKRKAAILAFIIRTVEDTGRAPTIREMMREFDITSTRGVTSHLDALESKGYIERDHRAAQIKVLRSVDGKRLALRHVEVEGG
jgi:repressor LexA